MDVGFGVGGCGFICGEGVGLFAVVVGVVEEEVESRSGMGLKDGVRESSGVGREAAAAAPLLLLSSVAALGGSACGFAASGRTKSPISWSSSAVSAWTLSEGEAIVSLFRGIRISDAGVAGDIAAVPEMICWTRGWLFCAVR